MHISKLRRLMVFRRRRMPKGKAGAGKRTAVFIILALCLILGTVVTARLRPVVLEMAVYTVTDEITKIINNSVSDKISHGSLNYSSLISFEKDSTGNITAMSTNMSLINRLQTEITNSAIEGMSAENATKLSIPLGNVLGGTVLSGRGPKIPVKILSVTNSNAELFSKFTSAGINQTHHQIILRLTIDVGVMIPGDSTVATVQTDVIIAETVIVGKVPDTLAEISSAGSLTDINPNND